MEKEAILHCNHCEVSISNLCLASPFCHTLLNGPSNSQICAQPGLKQGIGQLDKN